MNSGILRFSWIPQRFSIFHLCFRLAFISSDNSIELRNKKDNFLPKNTFNGVNKTKTLNFTLKCIKQIRSLKLNFFSRFAKLQTLMQICCSAKNWIRKHKKLHQFEVQKAPKSKKTCTRKREKFGRNYQSQSFKGSPVRKSMEEGYSFVNRVVAVMEDP